MTVEEKRHPFFISCARNLEPMLIAELKELGITEASKANAVHLGVEAELSREEVYRVVYGSLLASRVLRPLGEFECPDEATLYETAKEFSWDALIGQDQTFKVSASVADSSLTHSHYAALKVKDAIVDALREARGERPNVDRDTPDIRINLFIHRDQATISLYYSDGIMHKRGYRPHAVEAPLKENLAAAMLRLARWNGTEPLRDFFCGSGTILLEAAMVATHTPGGYFRDFQGFESLPDFDKETWARVKAELDAKIVPLTPGLIGGADIDSQAVLAARANIKTTPFHGAIAIGLGDFRKLDGNFAGSVIVTNPPYGVRLGGDEAEVHKLYEDFGYFLKMKCPGSRAVILFPEPKFEKDIWFKPLRGMFLDNGALDVRANVYEVQGQKAKDMAAKDRKEEDRREVL
jgi:putative N6-adenine-specific DNA methylase